MTWMHYYSRMSKTQTLADGTAFVTFIESWEIEPGMIVKLPDGRAGEVTDAMLPGWVFARPWDQCSAQAFMDHEIEPWIEEEN
jgi:hypothetical protein